MNKLQLKIKKLSEKKFLNFDNLMLLLKDYYDTDLEMSLTDAHDFMKQENIKYTKYLNVKTYLEQEYKMFAKYERDESSILDLMTLTCIAIMDKHTKTEQSLIYYLGRGKLIKDNGNNTFETDYVLTTAELASKIKETTKVTSVYLSLLEKKGMIKIEKGKVRKHYIESEIFIKWFQFRYNKKPLKY